MERPGRDRVEESDRQETGERLGLREPLGDREEPVRGHTALTNEGGDATPRNHLRNEQDTTEDLTRIRYRAR